MQDGASNTILLAEIRAGVSAIDSRGVWTLGIGSSALWADTDISDPVYGYVGDGGPNCSQPQADNTMNCSQFTAALGSGALMEEGMSCWDSDNNQQTARSMHPGGVNTCFADGSIHWISDFIQVSPSSVRNLSVWDRLMASADGMPIDASSY